MQVGTCMVTRLFVSWQVRQRMRLLNRFGWLARRRGLWCHPFQFCISTAAGEQLITTGPLVDFYSRPHPHINRFQYWELRVTWLMFRGECFRIPIYGTAR